ncbi:hypothetical protein SAMN02745751_02970 [Dethiosulfatibacter aminovorans DSM 17477]|uniref:DUF4878 domain-containing protein n=1 Tax=Dethiosulfatibacter aminovorans DSM 17477 TaxID=1121476 RepID=A0A1M6KT11_9FIRM|nr:hypothetical protein [Dethiosulfatibacter aminovorans]SHJ62014.1 hypothetical protein SAMN02745751_02970 [Dethiosulfatibacter aminovorans DSM 17477]
MIRKYKIAIMILLLMIVASSCTSTQEEVDYVTIYSIALDSVISVSEGLNHDMKYIAIDTATLEGATEEDIEEVMTYFDKYGVDVLDESFDSLRGKGMVINNDYLDGVLLRVENVNKLTNKKAELEVSKYKAGLGAVGIICDLINDGGTWKLKSVQEKWIS